MTPARLSWPCRLSLVLLALVALLGWGAGAADDKPAPVKVLFLGDKGHHRPAERFRQIQPILAKRGIALTYTEKMTDLDPAILRDYDGLLIYANVTKITIDQEKALLDYVASGKGLIALHCASYCFLNSPRYIALVGAQFRSHGTGVFRTTVAAPDHPIMKGYRSFSSWDETYLHHKHNDRDRTVLEHRVEGKLKEPWTWVRKDGKGRVFYTAWGHDQRTWGNPGFHELLERGIRWATGGDPTVVPSASADRPQMTPKRKDVKPFAYKEAKVPFYPPGERWGTTSEPLTQMQVPLDPEESLKHVVTPVDFEVKLFAADPHIKKPVCMNWDERGRLWIAETVDYPNERQPKGMGHDRIVICEDTDGDGVADKFTVFADKLSIPTGFTFYKGGVLVQQAPYTLYLRDTRGTGRADQRKVVFTGWSTSDTHAGPSNLQYGLDNWVYGIVGYAGFRGTIGDEQHSFRQGFYRFRPDGTQMEFLRSNNNNCWGIGFSEEGLLFGSTANGNPSVYLPIPNRYYESVRGWSSRVLEGIAGNAPIEPITDKVRQVDYHGRFTAGAGHALYTARRYPRQYWNRTAFVAEPTGHLVATFTLQRQGSHFRSRNAWNLLASDDEWTAPIMAEVGPDGCVWVIDWYNYIVQHNPTPRGFKTGKGAAYETPLRDKKHGRIWRLVPKAAKTEKPFTLQGASAAKLVATLKNDNLFWRRHAQRLLVERGQLDVVPDLIKLTEDPSADAIGLNVGAIHALWTMHGLGALAGKDARATAAAIKALKHPSPGVRRNAALVLPRARDAASALLESGALADADAQVRLAALLALAEMPASAQAGAAVAAMLARPENCDDRWIPDAATAAAAAHDEGFLTAMAARKGPHPARLMEVLARVAEHYARGGPVDSVAAQLVRSSAAEARVAEAFVGGLWKGWRSGRKARLSKADEAALAKSLPKLPPAARGKLLQLVSSWGSKSLAESFAQVTRSLLEAAADEKKTEKERIAAAVQAVELAPEDDETALKLAELITGRTPVTLAAGILDALENSRAAKLGPTLLGAMGGWTPGVRQAALQVLLTRSATTRELLAAAEKGTVRLSELALDQKQALAAHPDKAIAAKARKLLEKGGGLPNPDRQKVVEKLLPLVKKQGDAVKGKAVFKAHCAKCHTHTGEGTKIGPDLTGMAAHTRESLLVDIIDPSRSVEGNYRVYQVTTRRGKVLFGLLASETRTSLELFDAEGKKHVLLRENVESLVTSPKSLMPDGFESQLKEPELVDLLAFLTQRGKYLPLSLEKVATAVSTRGMFYSEDAEAERLIFPDWSPKTFAGVPFQLVDPRSGRVPNVVLLHGPQGRIPPKMPRFVKLPCNTRARAIHFLSGVSGWGYPYGQKGSVTMVVRLNYADGTAEEHDLRNGEHFADYIRRVDVPGSKFAFALRGQQVRYLTVTPKRTDVIKTIDLVKGKDRSAPVIMAVTVETR
jgi:putative membrane-bound dehydrogenase-like protein